jgi:hypothetical protein
MDSAKDGWALTRESTINNIPIKANTARITGRYKSLWFPLINSLSECNLVIIYLESGRIAIINFSYSHIPKRTSCFLAVMV